MFFYDPYFLLLIPAFLLAMYAQMRVRNMYTKYSRVPVKSGYSGKETARIILDANGLSKVPVEEVPGVLTDHYDPLRKVLRLSSGVYKGRSLASVCIAAHETGHAIQHSRIYIPLMARSAFFPVVRFSTWSAFPLFFIGFLFRTPVLMDLGIVLFAGIVTFQIITLPVEFNASKRAIRLLNTNSIITANEEVHTRKVLNAAALTYLAATAVAIMQLLRLVMLRRR